MCFNCFRFGFSSSSSLHFYNLIPSISTNSSVILASDFNCHHPSWDSKQSCSTGETIFNTFRDNNLLVVNTGQSAHLNFINLTNASCLDLAFASPSCTPFALG